jgi:hypothetical protein
MKPLKNLRCKPQGSEVFRCGSMGIHAYPNDLSHLMADRTFSRLGAAGLAI